MHLEDLLINYFRKVKTWDARTRLPGQRTRVRRGDAGGTPQTAYSCRVVPRGDSRIGPTRLKSAPTRPKSVPMRPKSGRLSPYRPYRPVSAESGRNSKKKKKKGAKRTVWLNLNTQTPSDLHTSSKTPKPANSLIVLLIIFYFVLVSNLWVVF